MMDVPNNLLPNNLAKAVLVTAVLFVGLLIWGTPFWQTNDDPGMAMVIHGFGVAGSGYPPWVIHSNILWAYFIRLIPEIPGVLGYTTASYGALFFALGLISYGLISRGVGLITTLLTVSIPGSWAILLPQFTVTAGLLAGAAIVCLEQFRSGRENRWLLLAAIAAFLSFLIRDLQFALVMLIALPVLPVALARDTRVQAVAFAWVAACIAAWLIDQTAYSDPLWQPFKLLEPLRSAFTDYRAAERLADQPELLAAHGFSLNDVFLLKHWFFADKSLADPERLALLLNDLGPAEIGIQSTVAGLQRLWIFQDMLPLLIVAVAASLLAGRWAILFSWLLFIIALAYLGYIGRPAPMRILIPVYAFLLVIAVYHIALHHIALNHLVPKEWFRNYGLLALLTLICLWNGWNLVQLQQHRIDRIESEQKFALHLHDQPSFVWADVYKTESVLRPFQPDTSFRQASYYSLGQMTLAPYSFSFAEEFSGDGLVSRLLTENGINLLAFDYHLPMLGTYCMEHHNRLLQSSWSAPTPAIGAPVYATVRCFLPLDQ
jgi:hypothetical protein